MAIGDAPLLRLCRHPAAAMIGLRTVGLSIAFATPLLYARITTPTELGTYYLAASWLAMLSVPAEFGMGEFVTRQASAGRPRDVAGWVHWGLGRVLLTAGTVIVLSALVSLAGRAPVFAVVLAGLALLLLNPACRVLQAGLRAEDRAFRSQVHQLVTGPALMLAFLGCLWFAKDTVSGIDLMAAMVLAGAVPLLLYAWSARRRGGDPLASPGPDARLVAALPFAVLAGLGIANTRIDVLLLSAFVPPAQLADYVLAARIAEVLSMPLLAAGFVLAPKIARASAAGGLSRLGDEIRSYTRLASLATLPVAIACVVAPGAVLGLVLGEAYVDGQHVLRILAAAQLFNVLVGPVGMILVMSGRERDTILALAASAAICAGLTLLLSGPYGIEGAATASAAALASWNLILWHRVRRTLALRPTALGI